MANKSLRFEKVNDTLPSTLIADTQYLVKDTTTGLLTLYISDALGAAAVQMSGKVPSYNDLTDKPTIPKTAADVGLGNVDNTSDTDKPISTATQTALDDKANTVDVTDALALKVNTTDLTTALSSKVNTSKIGVGSGICDLDVNIKVPLSRIPDSILGNLSYQGPFDMNNELPVADAINKGWYYIASNPQVVNGFIKGDWAVSNGTSWDRIDNTSAVQSVASRTGVITLTSSDLTDFATAVTDPLALKAPLASPTFTGTVTIPTVTAGDNSTAAASTAFVTTAISAKAPLASPELTGTPTAPTATKGTNTTQLATTAFVSSSIGDITKSNVSLGNVDNTSDVNKPVSTAVQTILDTKVDTSYLTSALLLKADVTTVTNGLALKVNTTDLTTALALKADFSNIGAASGICDLDVNKKVPLSRLPDSILGSLSYQGPRDMATALPTADASNKGWYYIASNASPINGYTKGDWAVSNGVTWDRIDNTSAVQSVAGRTGVITLSTTDLSDFATAVSTPLGLKAPLASPTFTGTVTIPTPASNDNSTTAASTAFVNTVVSTKAPLASPALTGIPTAPTAANGTNTTQIATTAFVLANALSAASPALTGTPTAPTAEAGTKTTQLATTEFVATSFAPIASPTFTGTVSGITATMVGLPNVDNTKDTDKPVSTAQKAALDAKAPLTITLTTKSTAYTLVATDKSCKINTTANITINKDVFSAGDSVIICNANTTATAITISIGTGLTCYLDGNVTAKTSLVLTARGTAAFMFDSGTVANAVGKSLS